MIETYEKLRLMDESGKNNHLIIEVNYKEDDDLTNQCKMLKLTYPNGDVAYVKKEYLMAFLFVIGKEEEQQKLIPQKLTHVRWYETIVGVKATKDIKKGEQMNFPIKISLPAEEKEIVGRTTKNSSLILPK